MTTTKIACAAVVISSLLLAAPAAAKISEPVAPQPVHLEVDELSVQPHQSWWQKITTPLRLWIGIRRPLVRPAVGTEFKVHASAYGPSPYQTDSTPCETASGTRVRPGVVASNFLPMGTILKINDELYIVEDRMNPRYNNCRCLDIWFPKTSDALEFGRQRFTITVAGYGIPGDDIRAPRVAVGEESPKESPLTQGELATEASIWQRVRIQFMTASQAIADALPTRLTGDVNRFDVDCFSDNPIKSAGAT
jgi:3D (Asp-Asp-Asp) domain-containing protein